MKYKDLPVGAKFYLGSLRLPNREPIDLMWTKVTQTGKAVLRPGTVNVKFDETENWRGNRDRANHGWNAYFQSNVHQWLNSDEVTWFKPKHDTDQVGYSEAKMQGFLLSFTEKERAFLLKFDVTQHSPMGSIKQFGRQVTESVYAALPAEIEIFQDAPYSEEGEYIPMLANREVFYGWLRTGGNGNNHAKYKDFYSAYATDMFCNDTRTVCPMIMISDKMTISDKCDADNTYYAKVQDNGILSNKIMEKYLIL